MPPMPPNASTPETLNPRVCKATRKAVINTESRSSLTIASRVARSKTSPFACLSAMKFVSAIRMKRTANHATAAIRPTSRIGSTASKMAAPASFWMTSIANAMPAIQMNARKGGPNASTKLSSQTLGVRANAACSRATRRLVANASTAVARTTTNTCTTHDWRPAALRNPETVSVPFMCRSIARWGSAGGAVARGSNRRTDHDYARIRRV